MYKYQDNEALMLMWGMEGGKGERREGGGESTSSASGGGKEVMGEGGK